MIATRLRQATFSICVLGAWQGALAQTDAFSVWLDALSAEAIAEGISAATVNEALADVRPLERVVELDRRQPEFRLTFWEYLERVVSAERIEEGRAALAEHRELLEAIGARYGIPPRFLVAAWGIESNFGRTQGAFPVIDALVTLAYDPRRAGFFRAELLNALRVLDQGHVGLTEMNGSWAGAMGQLQFMPSTFVRYARDGDGDGRKDIWTSVADAMESAANFMSSSGWRAGVTWGRQVELPADFDAAQAAAGSARPLAQWQRLGVRRADGSDLPQAAVEGSIVLPSGEGGPAFVVYHNYRVIMRWNRSHLFAVSIGHLADRIAGAPPLRR